MGISDVGRVGRDQLTRARGGPSSGFFRYNDGMKKTPLYDWHATHNGRIVDFAGWAMPVQYSTIIEEHQAVRNAAGLFDISHMGRLRIAGEGAVEFIERLVTCYVSTMKLGQVRYGLMTNEKGGILDDVLVYRLGDSDFGLVVNASNREKIITWIGTHLTNSSVAFSDETFETGMIALQGRKAAEVISPHVDFPLADLGYYRCRNGTVLDVPALVSRTGYTGEVGYEFVVPADQSERLWSSILMLGGGQAVTPCGLGCRDTLRLEAAMPLYGHELNEQTDPIMAGLSFAVARDKEFVGSEPIRKIASEDPRRVRVGLRLNSKRIAREGTPLLAGEQVVGEVTSGTFSPTLQASIAMGYVPAEFAEPGTPLGVDLRGKRESATVVNLPFYRRA